MDDLLAESDLLAVRPQRQRHEHHHEAGAPGERPPHVVADGVPRNSPRTDATRWVIGLTFTNACIQPGSVSAPTNTLDAKLSGMISANISPCTAPGVRTFIADETGSQLRQSANSIASRQPAIARNGSVWIRKPIR